VTVQHDLSGGRGHNQLSQGLANVDSEHGTIKPSHELGNVSNLCHTCILHQFFSCTLQMKINVSNVGITVKRARCSHEIELFLIGLLKDYDVPGFRTQNAWTKEAWTNVVSQLNDKFGTSYSLSQVNQEHELKKDYHVVKELKEESGFGWDNERKMVTGPADIGDSFVAHKHNSDALNWQDKSFRYFNELHALYDGKLLT
jgi:hypothetical protein